MKFNALILKYNGKELQETGMYSYGWRDYMPDLGRWNGMDQLSEVYVSTSPFAYVANNPVSMRDPDGRWMDANGHIDTSGNSNPFRDMAQSQMRMTQFMGQNPGEGAGGGGYTFTGTDAGSIFNYFVNRGNFSELSIGDGKLTWWKGTPTLTSYSGTDIHGDIDLGIGYSAKFKDIPLDAYKNWADWGASTVGGGFKYLADRRTALYNSGYWIDNLGQMRSTAYAGRARGSLIGLRGDYVRHTEMLGKYAKRAGYVGYGISAAQIGYGTYQDGGKFGIRAQVATANVVGGMAGAWLGGKAGTLAGGELGALIGVWFEGVGAIPGAAIGGAIGGIVGGILGGVYGGDYAEQWASGILNKPDPIK